ncbi:hypothetical protein BDQ12DRAFT_720636 [Crucibulum laeve]|uniref:Uncharacterized protein n=1 Tax=Crucibulum laeve TaxID=68775 RepID=A0A5C3M6D8_9AGAR|nr:hypothetical protein BDQ12DRAFT_720636 [Crucibulum laeve]
MARATRSSAALDAPPPQPPKRKRQDSPDHPHKQPRTEHDPHLAAALPLTDDDAQAILTVLESADTLGLLDRVFPLPDPISLRALLAHPDRHPLRTVRTAIHHLFPISSHPRSSPSPTAAQQLLFCQLALSLLDQASRNVIDTLPDISNILSSPPTSPRHSPVLASSKYALVQHLPSGDYWSSLTNDASPASPTPDFKNLQTANAELVAILPSASSSSVKDIPSLGSYYSKTLPAKKSLPSHRRVTTGSFLDYGLWASFAPSFDQGMELVGRAELGQVYFQREQRRREREAVRREILEGRGSIADVPNDADAAVQRDDSSAEASSDIVFDSRSKMHIDPNLEGLLTEDETNTIKAALGNLELENAVQELLDRNRRALRRLEELQISRLLNDGSASTAEEGSEEWDTAQSIVESLITLASLRPRSSTGEVQSIVPPSSVLRSLQRTMALEPSPGWYGTLPSSRSAALRDDLTVKMRSVATPTAQTASTPAPVPAPATPTAPAAPAAITPAYPGYAYGYSATPQQAATQPYRPQSATSYSAYKPTQTTSYYQGGYVAPAAQPQQSYYPQQNYSATSTASGQQIYGTPVQQPYGGYSSWYSQYPAAATAGNPGSGRGTPQPTTSNYGSFYNANAGTSTPPPGGTRTPAVANTVMATKSVTGHQPAPTAATWSYVQPTQQGQAPTLPQHLRTAQPAATGVYQQTSYYGQYQMQQSPATPAR